MTMSSEILSDQATYASRAWVSLIRGHAVTRRALTAQLQAQHGLTVNDFEALLLLSQAEGKHLRRVDLADGLQLTASGVTRLLDGLERHGLVEKATCDDDGRVTYAVLTRAGGRKLERAAFSHVAAINRLFEARYTHDELDTLARLLSRLPGATREAGRAGVAKLHGPAVA
jgi:DNA-binding MarR family transcriptional regulator